MARNWISHEDLRENAMRLMVCILVNSSDAFFKENIDQFINRNLTSKSKNGSICYQAILDLLYGYYKPDSREEIKNSSEVGLQFAASIRPDSFIANLVNYLCDFVFFTTLNSPNYDSFEIITCIVLQIAAFNIALGNNLLHHLQSPESNLMFRAIGIKCIRIILDPTSGFQKHARSKRDPDFTKIIGDLPLQFEPNIISAYKLIDGIIGLNVMGTNGYVVDSIVDEKSFTIPNPEKDIPDEKICEFLVLGPKRTILRESRLFSNDYSTGSFTSLSVLNRSNNDLFKSVESITLTKSASESGFNQKLSHESKSVRENVTNLAKSLGDSKILLYSKPEKMETYISESNEKVKTALSECFRISNNSKIDLRKYIFDGDLYDQEKVKRKKTMKLTSDQKLAISLLLDILKLLKLIPSPEFLGGSLFIGTYLNHSRDEIAIEVAKTFKSIFIDFPELRIGIINGFINYLKSTPYNDNVSICTIVLMVAVLLNLWPLSAEKRLSINPDIFYRVSCKLDAIMLIIMTRPYTRIREMCMQILNDFQNIQKDQLKNVKRESLFLRKGTPLIQILFDNELIIRKRATYAFLEKSSRGSNLTPTNAAGLKLPDFLDVARSQYSQYFNYYLAELAVLFCKLGREKATRHCAKFLIVLFIPVMGQAIAEKHLKYILPYSAGMNLVFALAGTPVF